MVNQKLQEKLDAVPNEIKTSAKSAWRWANEELTNMEGSGWCFYLLKDKRGYCFSLSKPSWSADHLNSIGQPTGALAIVYAVCEYQLGY